MNYLIGTVTNYTEFDFKLCEAYQLCHPSNGEAHHQHCLQLTAVVQNSAEVRNTLAIKQTLPRSNL